jgi:hypothetical protein
MSVLNFAVFMVKKYGSPFEADRITANL